MIAYSGKRWQQLHKLCVCQSGRGQKLSWSVFQSSITLQRHFRVLTKFAHVESRLSGHKQQREVVFYAPVNLCARRACSTSVAVGVMVSDAVQ